jgi:hypothetical protein
MATQRAEVNVGESRPVDLDFETNRWSAEADFAEGDFPLVASLGAKRYEIYSDGTFAEEEL